jgi:hypothetical protein
VVHFAEASSPARRDRYGFGGASYDSASGTLERSALYLLVQYRQRLLHGPEAGASVGCWLDQGKNALHLTFRALTPAWWRSHETVQIICAAHVLVCEWTPNLRD